MSLAEIQRVSQAAFLSHASRVQCGGSLQCLQGFEWSLRTEPVGT